MREGEIKPKCDKNDSPKDECYQKNALTTNNKSKNKESCSSHYIQPLPKHLNTSVRPVILESIIQVRSLRHQVHIASK